MEKDFLITYGTLVSLSVPVCWQSSRQNVYFYRKNHLVNVFYQSSATKKGFNFVMENDAGIQSLFLKRQQF